MFRLQKLQADAKKPDLYDPALEPSQSPPVVFARARARQEMRVIIWGFW